MEALKEPSAKAYGIYRQDQQQAGPSGNNHNNNPDNRDSTCRGLEYHVLYRRRPGVA